MRNLVTHIETAVGVRRFVWSRCGASAAEFALVFPIFMLCLFGITAFASTLFIENNMVNAARESVRQMAVLEAPFTAGAVQCDAPQAQVVGSAEYVACTYLTFWGTDFTVNASTDCPAEDKATVQITLDASQAAVMDVFGFFNGKTLSAEVSMRKEDDCA
jgi:Flp pilus assembly protein TadG